MHVCVSNGRSDAQRATHSLSVNYGNVFDRVDSGTLDAITHERVCGGRTVHTHRNPIPILIVIKSLRSRLSAAHFGRGDFSYRIFSPLDLDRRLSTNEKVNT